MEVLDVLFVSNILDAEILSTEPYGSGHIHETYKIITRDRKAYILQKINHSIFSDIEALQENIKNVLNHQASQENILETILKMRTMRNGKSYFLDEKGCYWRVYDFIEGSKTYDKITSTHFAYEAGVAYGNFISSLQDFPADSLHETIPEFHDLESRLQKFEQSIIADTRKSAIDIESEIEFVRKRVLRMKRILELGKKQKFTLRVTHNDTKINNVLFNEYDKAICVIDLDTVMPGYIHYDFGDAVRTGAASADEDETDLSKMFIDLKLFEAFSRGFLKQTIVFMNQVEIDELFFAPQLLTFIIAMRFLTDYINGDVYFKVNHEKHNLQRWFAQKKLLISMEENEIEMQQIIKRIEINLKNGS